MAKSKTQYTYLEVVTVCLYSVQYLVHRRYRRVMRMVLWTLRSDSGGYFNRHALQSTLLSWRDPKRNGLHSPVPRRRRAPNCRPCERNVVYDLFVICADKMYQARVASQCGCGCNGGGRSVTGSCTAEMNVTTAART